MATHLLKHRNIPNAVHPFIVELLSLFTDMSENTKFRFRERHFVCGVPNCHQKFVSASSVVRHIARVHQRDDSCNGKAEI